MAGFDDLIPAAMPYLATEWIDASTGSDWEWSYDIVDDDGTPVSFAGAAGTCVVRPKTGAAVISPAVAFPAAGQVTCTAAAAATEDLDPGQYYHEVEVTVSGKTIKIVGSGDSVFNIKGQETT